MISRKVRRFITLTFIAILVLITIDAAASMRINEIMYNPLGSDTGREWIELTGCENLSDMTLLENNVNHHLVQISEVTDGFCIICDNCSRIDASLGMFESSFSLANNGEYLAIIYRDEIVDYVNYSALAQEGQTISRCEETWMATDPTPGTPNECADSQPINFTTNQTSNMTYDYTSNTTTNNQTDITTYNRTNMTSNNETNISYEMNITSNNSDNGPLLGINITDNNTTIPNATNATCSILLSVRTNQTIYENGQAIRFKHIVSGQQIQNMSIEYWIEDLYGTLLKSKITTTNLNEKSYTPKLDDKTTVAFINSQVIGVPCTRTSQMIIIRNEDFEEERCDAYSAKQEDEAKEMDPSYLTMTIEDNSLHIDAYRGKERKYQIISKATDLSTNKTSELARMNLQSGCEVTSEIALPKCANLTITSQGLGFTHNEDYHSECARTSRVSETSQQSAQDDMHNENVSRNNANPISNSTSTTAAVSNELTSNAIYESRTEKTKQYSLIGMLAIVAALTITGAYRIFLHKNTA